MGIKLSSMELDVRRMIERAYAGSEDPYAGMGEEFWVAAAGTAFYERLIKRVTADRIFPKLMDSRASCTAHQGDIVKVAPGHTETVTGAGGLTFNKAGVRYKGYGGYSKRPAILMDGAACSALFTAADVVVDGLNFSSGHADLAYFGLITAKGVKIQNCRILENIATEDWLTAIQLGAADNDCDGVELINNEIIGVGATAKGSIIINKDQKDVKILGNRITGQFGATTFAPIYAPSTEILINILVAHNMIHNLHNDNAVVGISLANTASTGWVCYNLCYALDVAGSTPFLGGATGLAHFENYYTFEGNKSGYLRPAMGTAA